MSRVSLTTAQNLASVRNTGVTHLPWMSKPVPHWQPGVLTQAALLIVVEKFADIARKDGKTPYLSHLLAVSALVMEHGGSEEQTAAGLLHDIIEDVNIQPADLTQHIVETAAKLQNDPPLDHAIAARVVQMVEANTDGTASLKRDQSSWRKRKENYIAALSAKPRGDTALLVSLADKAHNAEATLAQVRRGQKASDIYKSPPFNAGPADQKWYYSQLVDVFRDKFADDSDAAPLVRRLQSAVHEIFVDVGTGPNSA